MAGVGCRLSRLSEDHCYDKKQLPSDAPGLPVLDFPIHLDIRISYQLHSDNGIIGHMSGCSAIDGREDGSSPVLSQLAASGLSLPLCPVVPRCAPSRECVDPLLGRGCKGVRLLQMGEIMQWDSVVTGDRRCAKEDVEYRCGS
jgi:hypothetical protein